MASVSSSSYSGRYFKFTVTQSGTSTKVNWKFEVLGGSSNYYTASPINCTINGHSVYEKGLSVYDGGTTAFPRCKGSKSGTYDVGSYGSVTIKLSGRPWYYSAGDAKSNTLSMTKPTYAVKYNANGGSGAPSSQTKTYGTALTLRKETEEPTRVGYTFKNWNTKKDGSGTSYSSGGSYKTNAAVTLYAQWTENKITVNYYSNYATYAAFKGEEVNVSANTNTLVYTTQFHYNNEYPSGLANLQNVNYIYLSRTGYAPTGYWGTSLDGGILVNQNTSFSTGQALAEALGKSLESSDVSIDLYAQWQENAYVLAYDSNGGFGEMDSQTIEWGELFTLSDNAFKRAGYKFVGWNVYRNNDNTWYATGRGWITEDEIIANGYSKKLYANQCELTFDNSWVTENEEARLYTMYAVWEMSGGVVYIDNGVTFEPYLTYIDNGTSWDLYLVYVDDGTNWNMMS